MLFATVQKEMVKEFNDSRKVFRSPSYADREITPGSIYHVLMYGKNAMGSHAGQVNAKERWQIPTCYGSEK